MPAVGPGATAPFESELDRKKRLANENKGGAANPLSSALDLGGNSAAGSLAEAIERQAAVQRRLSEENAATGFGGTDVPGLPMQSDPVDALLKGLFSQYNSINVPGTPLEQLQNLAAKQIASQFDPVIGALAQQIESTTKRGKANQGEARNMYNSLGADFLSQLPQITQQFAAEDQATNQRYDNAQKQLQDMYGQQSAAQNQVLQSLGIQAAAPDASAQANADQKYFQGSMEGEQQAALNALAEQQMAQENYQRNLGSTTKVAGENTAQDIGRQLEDYLGAANQQMTGLQGQRANALSALVQQLQSQDAERVAQQEQQQFQNLMALSNFQLDAARLKSQNEMDRANLASKMQKQNEPLFKGTSSQSGALNMLSQLYPDQPILASNLMNQLNDVLQNPDVVKGKYVLQPGDPSLGKNPVYADVDQRYMENLLRREIEQENIQNPGRYSPADISKAIDALAALLGKMR